MNIESGVVEKITEKDGTYGKMYSMKVNGNWYGIGKYPPKCNEGDSVEFQWTARGNFRNAEPKTLTKVQRSQPTPAAQPYAPAPDKRQETISKQWAINAGVQWMTALIAAEALPNLKKTATASEKYDYLNALLMDKVNEFLGIATGQSLDLTLAVQQQSRDDAPVDEQWD